ncbi:MAG: hypothetical protein H7X99_10175 [Saprospiraceae bacterium]|nr:hypothetical protein [Saprospiraceae bacterium]
MKLSFSPFLFASLFFCLIDHAKGAETIHPGCIFPCNQLEEYSPLTGRILKIRVYLEGALMNSPAEFSNDGRRLMRDDLRISPFDGQNYIPVNDPYQTTVKFVDLSVSNEHVGLGSSPELSTIADSAGVFGLTGANAIVDWVFVEIRSSADNKEVIATRSGLLQRDGDIVDVDGVSDLNFPDLNAESFFVVVRHRNHLGAMTQLVTGNDLIDFTSSQTPVFDFGTSLNPIYDYSGTAMNGGYFNVRALWAGDFNADLVIRCDPPGDDHNILIIENAKYSEQNMFYNGVIGYFQGDYDLNSKVKYDNPNDDKNLLFSQLKLYSLNTELLSNFYYFTEQVPRRN